MKNRKSAGTDQIQNELLKYGGDRIIEQLATLLTKIFQEERIPDEWRTSILITLFKKGDKKTRELQMNQPVKYDSEINN